MKRIPILAGVLVLASLAVFGPPARAEKEPSKGAFSVDVAIDATTIKFSRQAAVLPSNIVRGDTFIVDGLIYPVGSIASGNTAFPPTSVHPIGKWVCRGTFQTDTQGLGSGVTPFVYSTQYFLFHDGSAVVTEGPEGGANFLRAVTGGWAGGAGSSGQSLEEPIGANATGLFNVRFRFMPGNN